MSHPRADAPGNVVLWRCVDWYVDWPHVEDCCEDAGCQPCGFRTPARCRDCENKAVGNSRVPGDKNPCWNCWDVDGRPNYTPRQPGKGGAA